MCAAVGGGVGVCGELGAAEGGMMHFNEIFVFETQYTVS